MTLFSNIIGIQDGTNRTSGRMRKKKQIYSPSRPSSSAIGNQAAAAAEPLATSSRLAGTEHLAASASPAGTEPLAVNGTEASSGPPEPPQRVSGRVRKAKRCYSPTTSGMHLILYVTMPLITLYFVSNLSQVL